MKTSLKNAYDQPAIRFHQSWTPALVSSALTMLMSGKLQQASLLADALLGDDRVQPTLSNRVNGVLGLNMSFEPADDAARSKRIAEALEEDFWDMFPEKALAELHRYGLLVGVCVGELVWFQRRGRVLPKLKIWHPSRLEYDAELNVWYLHTKFERITITPGDGKWLLYTPYNDARPWASGLVRGLALPWLAKHFAVKDWQGYSEVHGSPTKVGHTPAGAKTEDKEKFFDRLISWANTAIAVSALGQNLTTEVGGGSLAAARVHESVRADLLESDTESLATILHEQALRHWTEFNFGNAEWTPWALWDSDPPADDKAIAETVNTAADALTKLANLSRNGVPVDLREVAERLNIPLLAEDEIPPPPESEPPTPEEDPEEEPEQPEEPETASLNRQRVRLASGDSADSAQGFIEGQMYVDNVADAAAAEGAPVFGEFTERVREIIDLAQDYDEMRTALADLYAESDPSAFADVFRRALLMSHFAGRYAVIEDTQ